MHCVILGLEVLLASIVTIMTPRIGWWISLQIYQRLWKERERKRWRDLERAEQNQQERLSLQSEYSYRKIVILEIVLHVIYNILVNARMIVVRMVPLRSHLLRPVSLT